MAKRSNKRIVGSYPSKLRSGPHNVEGTMDDSETHAIRLWEQDVGSSVKAMGSCQLCSYTRVQAVRIREVHSRHLWTQPVRVRLRRFGICSQLTKLSMLWTEPQWVEIARHSYDLITGYLEWKSIRVKDAMLPTRDDSVQSANPLPERMPIEIEILRRELEVERRKIWIWIISTIQS